jgi:hypothetical protein
MLAVSDADLEKLWIPALTAVAVAIVTHFQKSRADLLNRRADRIRQQLDKLYGPLMVLTHENAALMVCKTTVAQKMEDMSPGWGEYAKGKMVANNAAILALLQTGVGYMDPRDSVLFMTFMIDRSLTSAPNWLGDKVQELFDNVWPLARPQLADVVDQRCKELATEWRNLTYGWWGRLRRSGWVRVEEPSDFVARIKAAGEQKK